MGTKGTVSVRTSRQEKTRATRRQLLDAAAKIFAVHGYEKTGVADIVAAAEVSVGTFYHHFDSKNALFEELWSELRGTLNDAVAAAQESARSAVRSARSGGVTDESELFDRGARAYFTFMWKERETARAFFFGGLPAQFAETRRRDEYSWIAENSTMFRSPDTPTDRIVNKLIVSAVSESLVEIMQCSDDAEAETAITAAIHIVAAVDRLGSPSSPMGLRI
ncbi:TetR/AcrR family transcriptional regulator [Rhodococcus sp. NPDC003318]|uniref:TetR/AcrR family transcriptional regulator n=1 Tax=Rhodococcus sp. NPDC003318 TaxID=3364503 RepID=UPI0036A8646E